MEFKELQEKVTKTFLANLKRDNIRISEDYLMMKLTEELGEVIQSYIVHKKKCRPEKYKACEASRKDVAKELSDVIGLAFVISKKLKINLEEAIVKKWITQEWVKKK